MDTLTNTVSYRLVVLDNLVSATAVLLSSVLGASGVTQTLPPTKCRFCGASYHYDAVLHKDGCKYVPLVVAQSKYHYATRSGYACLLRIYSAAVAYCNQVVAFLTDPEVLDIIGTDDSDNSNLQKLSALYAARDEYLAVFSERGEK